MATARSLTQTLKRSASLLGAAALLATTRASQAQNVAPQGGSVFGSFSYADSEGPGQIGITDQGPDAATGGERITVQVTQNGVTYPGSGFELLIARPSLPDIGSTLLIAFTIRAPSGPVYQFRGKLRAGGFIMPPVYGSGAYERAGTGIDLEQWTLSGG
jgi:hypothetical protein